MRGFARHASRLPERPTPLERASNLPARRTRLIGRGADLDEVRALVLHGDGRLVTLTGAGGAGKTSLALETGRRLTTELADGAFVVDLDVVAEGSSLVETVSSALGLADQSRPPDVVLTEFLEPRQLLLVVDNCERLAPLVAELADRLLDRCPDLRILATSRSPLHVRGESVFLVRPLPVPDAGASAADAAAAPSVRLFAERAASLRPGFVLSDDVVPAVVSICRRVEGLPLAIELAAAHVAALSPHEVAARLAGAGSLPHRGTRAVPARHLTFKATLDWSYGLLTLDQQRLFRRLAIFAGGWTMEAAEAVCGAGAESSPSPGPGPGPGPESSPTPSVHADLIALVEASLVVRGDAGDGSRFRLLAPIAEYAQSRLDDSDESDAIHAGHARYYLALAARRAPGTLFASPDDLDRIAAEHENCLAALRWAEHARALPVVLGLNRGLAEFWRVRGLLRVGLRRLEAALVLSGDAPSPHRGTIMVGTANYSQLLGEHAQARERALAADAMLESIGELRGRAAAHGVLGDVAIDLGDLAAARRYYEDARPLLERAAERGATPEAFWCANVGGIALREGRLDEALELLDRARAGFEAGPPVWYLGPVLTRLGAVARARRDPHTARSLLIDALAELGRFGARVEAIDCLEEFARVELDLDEVSRAATLLGAASGLRDATGLDVVRPAHLTQTIDRARASLLPDVFEPAWIVGRGLSLDDAIAFASLPPSRGDVPATPRPARAASVPPDLLTPRERQVAGLVAEGLSNREIGERLMISPGTARIHVERILSKLGQTSRVQIARWVLRGEPAGDERPLEETRAQGAAH